MRDDLSPIIGIRNGLILALILWVLIFLLWEKIACVTKCQLSCLMGKATTTTEGSVQP